MKIQILSDLHVEFGAFEVPRTDADVVIFAGDIGVGTEGLEWIAGLQLHQEIIYVLGNHEYYRHDIGLADSLKAQAPEHIHVLDKDAVIIDGVRFLGATLWTDFQLFGADEQDFAMQTAGGNMADFSLITYEGRKFTPQDSIDLHLRQRQWLRDRLAEDFDGKTAVISHHFPSAQSIHPRFASDMLTPAFGSSLETMLDGEQVALWVHGHTHDAFDYSLNGTRVICNPRGYVGYEKGEFFRPDLVVEI